MFFIIISGRLLLISIAILSETSENSLKTSVSEYFEMYSIRVNNEDIETDKNNVNVGFTSDNRNSGRQDFKEYFDALNFIDVITTVNKK